MPHTSQNLLIILLKEPTPGKVKTRLAKDIGNEQAAKHYKAMVTVLLMQLEGLQNTHIRFAYAPDDAHEAIPFWILPQLRGNVTKIENQQQTHYLFTPEKNAPQLTIDFQPQSNGDLGQRLNKAAQQGFTEGYQKIALIGTDCPSLSSRWINTALLQTKPGTLTLGPTPDGGYYLLATAAHHPELFTNIPWSTETTRQATIEAAKKINLTPNLLPELQDIDDLQGWNQTLQTTLAQKLKTALKSQT